MSIEELRRHHPRFVYRSYDFVATDTELTVSFDFLLEPDIRFRPSLHLPLPGRIDPDALRPLVFHLGLVEAISYWKAACPPVFRIEAGLLTANQQEFWQTLFIEGLGEFFYRNAIDFTQPGFFSLDVSGSPVNGNYLHDAMLTRKYKGSLVLVGGGKDSAATLELLNPHTDVMAMVINPTRAAMDVIATSGVSSPLVVRRRLDPQLLALNQQGYLNGHTPFSAFLGFAGLLAAYVYGRRYVIVSNEQSANEGNVRHHGRDINHQYSKSFAYERAFRTYSTSLLSLDEGPEYFSFLRPLNDLQIASVFSRYDRYFGVFRSCNAGNKTNIWCGQCPKCAFTYLVLYPFLHRSTMTDIFGGEYFRRDVIVEHIRAFVGLTAVKPFECVGTRAESLVALQLGIDKMRREGSPVPRLLGEAYAQSRDIAPVNDQIVRRVLHGWDDQHMLPAAYERILRDAMGE